MSEPERTAATSDPGAYLSPTWFLDSDSPPIVAYAQRAVDGAVSDVARACRLFYAVRDGIRYSAYGIQLSRDRFRASHVLAAGQGWCVPKSCLLAAAARAVGIPCRLGYADVRNHLATEKLLRWMGTDIFYYHGYNELYVDGRWVKATAAFNRSLCDKARLPPLEFDGRNDSLYHPFDLEGRRHMEYLRDHGQFADLPYDAMIARFRQVYPNIARLVEDGESPLSGDFEADVAARAGRSRTG
jgi:transglutaminase-like putative cysteine protease